MVNLPENLLDFAENSDSWLPKQIDDYLNTIVQARGTHAGALLNGIAGLFDNPFLTDEQVNSFRTRIKTLTEGNNG